MWFGTQDGLNKYDGYSFTTYEYDPQDSTSLMQNNIFSLWEDRDGFFWIGTAESGISKFDRTSGKFTHYRPEKDTSTYIPLFRAVSAFNEDSEGYLWVGNWGGELRRFDKENGKFLPQQFKLDYRQNMAKGTFVSNRAAVYCIYKDRSGTLWVGSSSGLYQVNLIRGKENQPSTVSFTHYGHELDKPNSLSSDFVSAVFEDKAGLMWIGTDGGGLNSFDRKTNSFTHYRYNPNNPNSISSNTITANTITEDSSGNLWIGTDNGLNKLNQERTYFTRFAHDPNDPTSISSNFIYSLFLSEAGILWIGSASEGISKLDLQQKPFKHYRHNPTDAGSLSHNTITGVTGSKGNIWIGTLGGGLNAFDRKTGKFRHYRHEPGNPESIRSDSIFGISESSDGGIWIRSGSFLSFFSPETATIEHYPYDKAPYRQLDADIVQTMYTDRQGLLWLGTYNGLKSFNRKTGEIMHYKHDPRNVNGLSDHSVYAILQDRKGYIWVGHGSVGLSKLDKKTGVFTRYLPDPDDSTSLSTSIVYSIYEDYRGTLWFGTSGGGLCGFDPQTEKFTTYTKKQGLADNTIYSILEDDRHNLWLVTGRGLSRFSPSSQIFHNYDFSDIMPSGIASEVPLKGADGTLYYGGNNGLIVFDPMLVKPNRYVPPVVITEFRLFDKLIPGKEEAKEITLQHGENFFSFEFSALNYKNSSKNQYAYQLVGIDKDWVYGGTRRVASYTDIAPGEYVFHVKGSNNDGIWNNEGVSMRIIIHPPWWRSWWAYAFYTLCLIAVVLVVDKSQRKRLIQKEREKARERELAQAREIERAYHELKQTQAQLVQKEKMASLGELTAGIAHEIQNPLNFVNNFSEVSQELCQEVQEEVRQLSLSPGEKANLQELVSDLSQNQKKVLLHGQRADAIVKGMLEHSRASTGEKRLTDINALVEEYIRLAYAGVRAREKDFTCALDTCYDQSLKKMEVVPQELGRVLLNLFNNAFYAVRQKQTLDLPGYEPQVRVSTRQFADKVEVRVLDNGIGIPDKVRGKIFQPFYTTKPAGQGTGLGLSLSYDIITKGHGGELSMATEEGEWTEFSIVLPFVPLSKELPAAFTAPPPPADTFPQP
ncbi:sensor histidine kinase [Pontibacter saemangeumensis]|uniref:histidine kinase n=2 Tax=Pontibacter saemangeumensis TaxID=1084525 RepID=A0ABP8LJ46_9BACT